MESIKDIEIKDLGITKKFRIRLFDAEAGLDFIDSGISRIKQKLEIKPFLKDLLPLASLLDESGRNVVIESLTLQTCYGIFQNPLSILELGIEILKHQQVFLKDSETFQPLMKQLSSVWNTKTSESETASDTLSMIK